jgi:type II secretory pathway pseudopilin PulG
MSLVEVVAALAVCSVLYAIAVPNFRAMRAPYALRTTAQQVASHLDMARQRAIARNARHRVVFSPGGYYIERETAPNTFVADSGVFAPPHDVAIGAADPANPLFNSRGMLAASVSVPISTHVGSKTVTVNVLGRTTIQ